MSKFECYRIWRKDGTYEVAVATNREDAVRIAIREKGVKESDIKAVGKATQYGRLFQYPFN